MATNFEKLQAFLGELNKEREAYQAEAVPQIQQLYRTDREKVRKPEAVRDSSFLYIRSYPADVGVRPFSGINFWNSPDLTLTPANVTNPLQTNALNAGGTYNIQCRLHNRGDISIPFPKVEFFLSDPTLGFSAQFATYLGVSQMEGVLLANGSGHANFAYQVPLQESGHKCLIARTFSFSPLDKSADLNLLDAPADRHIGQKNLNVVAQETNYMFNLIHQPNTTEAIEFIPLTAQEMLTLGAPALNYRNFEGRLNPALFMRAGLTLVNSTANVTISTGKLGFEIVSKGSGATIDEQLKIPKGKEKDDKRGDREWLQYRKRLLLQQQKLNRAKVKTALQIKIPHLGLKPGEAAAFNIINTNRATREIKGGIVLIVIG